MESSKLSDAIKTNDLNTLDSILADPKTDLAQRNCQGQGFLHLALLTGADLAMFNILLSKIDIAIRDMNGNTIMDLLQTGLHPEETKHAVESWVRDLILEDEENGEKEAYRLLQAGWSYWPTTIHNTKGKTNESVKLLDGILQLKKKVAAVHDAVHEGRLEDLRQLLDHKHLATIADQTGLPPLHKAVLCKHLHLVQYFASNFSPVLNTRDNMGRTAMHYAAALTDCDLLYKTLIEAGADPTATDLMGQTARDYMLQSCTTPADDTVKKIKELHPQMTTFKDKATATPDETAGSTCDGTDSFSYSRSLSEVKATPSNVQPLSSARTRAPPPTTEEGQYIARHLGRALTLALAEIVQKQPPDPIEYLGQWLYTYRRTINDTIQD